MYIACLARANFLTHQAPADRWSLVSHMVSINPSVCTSVRPLGKQKHATTLHGASWVTKFARLVFFSFSEKVNCERMKRRGCDNESRDQIKTQLSGTVSFNDKAVGHPKAKAD